MRSAKAQTSIEFLILLGFMLLIFASFFVVATDIVTQNNARAIREALIDVSDLTHEELLLANQVNIGYYRNFTLPEKISEQGYAVWILNNTELVLNTTYSGKTYEYLIFLPFSVTVAGQKSGEIASGSEEKHVLIRKNSTGIDLTPS
jgi:hypothetical protein